jgi:acyl-CoA thioesterase YciA
MREVVFHAPVHVGDLVSFFTSTKRVGTTSVTVLVEVMAERGHPGGAGVKVTEAEVVFVHVGPEGRPRPIPAAPRPPRPAHSGSGTKGSKQRRQRAS